MITTMPAAYLRIVCAKIAGTGKFLSKKFFLSTEKNFSARTFSPKNRSTSMLRERNHRKKLVATARKNLEKIDSDRSVISLHIVGAKCKHKITPQNLLTVSQGNGCRESAGKSS